MAINGSAGAGQGSTECMLRKRSSGAGAECTDNAGASARALLPSRRLPTAARPA